MVSIQIQEVSKDFSQFSLTSYRATSLKHLFQTFTRLTRYFESFRMSKIIQNWLKNQRKLQNNSLPSFSKPYLWVCSTSFSITLVWFITSSIKVLEAWNILSKGLKIWISRNFGLLPSIGIGLVVNSTKKGQIIFVVDSTWAKSWTPKILIIATMWSWVLYLIQSSLLVFCFFTNHYPKRSVNSQYLIHRLWDWSAYSKV